MFYYKIFKHFCSNSVKSHYLVNVSMTSEIVCLQTELVLVPSESLNVLLDSSISFLSRGLQ